MSSETYPLLTVSRNGDRELVWRGALADQGVDPAAKLPALRSLGRVLTALPPRRERCLLTLEMTADEPAARLSARPRGLLAPLFRKPLDKVVARLNGMGRPLTVRDGGFVYNLYQPPVPSARMVNHLAHQFMHGNRPVRPSTCTLQVTARCQLDCYHCSAARFKSRDRQELTTEEWLSVIAQAQDLGVFNIVFTGGEPLLRRDLYELIAAVDPQRAQAMMFTNGLLLTAENVQRLREAGLYAVNVSLDDPRPEVHNRLRRAPQVYERALEGLARALEAGLLVGISTYAGPHAVREGLVEETLELGRRLAVHEVTVFDVVPTGKLLPLQEKSLLSEEDKDRLIAMERHYNQQPDYPHVITQALVNGPQGAGCFAAFSQFYMTAYGDVDPCDFTPLTFGNIRDASLEETWRRMLAHPAYQHRCNHCRMQDPAFRRQYIDDIPEDALLPWPAFEELRSRPHSPRETVQSATRAATELVSHEQREEQVTSAD